MTGAPFFRAYEDSGDSGGPVDATSGALGGWRTVIGNDPASVPSRRIFQMKRPNPVIGIRGLSIATGTRTGLPGFVIGG